MALVAVFDPKSPPYKQGEKYGISAIETFFDHVEILCSKQISPVRDNEDISVSEILARLESIFEEESPTEARPYLEDMSRAIRSLEAWQAHPRTQIRDDFYEFFGHYNPREMFAEWASEASKYYPAGGKDLLASGDAAEIRLTEAKDDLQKAIRDMRGKELMSQEVEEAWQRAEDALYYVIANGLTPQTSEDERSRFIAQAAYVYSIDNLCHNESMRRAELASIKRPMDYDGPFTNRELERLVIFEAGFPASRGSDIGFYLDHKTEHLSYGEELAEKFNKTILCFNAMSRRKDHDPELTI